MTNTSATLAQAHSLHQQGRLQEAVSLYQQVLNAEPRNSDALHLLGLAMAALGQMETALNLLSAAVQIQPSDAAIQTNLASALSAVGRYAESLPHYERAIILQPNLAVAHRGRGVAQMQVGKTQEALASFATASQLDPADDTALNGLGVVLERAGRVQEARQSFNQAVALNPSNIEAHHNLGLLEAAAGRHAEALASIDRALALQPNNPVLLGNRALQLLSLNRGAEALASFDRALAIQPGDAITHHNRGLALMQLQRPQQAAASFARATQLAPDFAQAHLWLAKAHLELERPEAALASLDRSLAAAPEVFDTNFQRGIILTLLERHAESVAAFSKALSLDEKSAEATNNRGAVLLRMFRPMDALADFVEAVRINPSYADAYINAGNALRGLGRNEEAIRYLDRGLALKPNDATALWTKAILKLAMGEFREGWPLYESRFDRDPAGQVQHTLQMPRWNGAETLTGKTLFVRAEQGLGDTLQFCRYIHVLEERGANVVFEVQPVLKRLLGSLGIRGRLIGRGEPIPECDLHIPLLSLPLALQTDLDTIPSGVPYLQVDEQSVQTWRKRLEELPGFKIGIHWQGNPEAERRAVLQARSFPLAALAPIAALENVTLVSLQKGSGAEQRTQVGFAHKIAQLTDPQYIGADEIATETAAILKTVDLVVTADTALAHLAGALGARVWLALQDVPDWRWMLGRSDSPWYPTMRLFRQRVLRDWEQVFEQMAQEIAVLAQR